MSDAIIGRIDEMGNRIDDLEKSIGELMDQAGVEAPGEKEALGTTNEEK
jgi:heat shock factor-binding protein 1